MQKSFTFSVVTPLGEVLNKKIVHLRMKTDEGSLGLLADHAPIFVVVKKGNLWFLNENNAGEKIKLLTDSLFRMSANNAVLLSKKQVELS